jgi:hypothetical protein
MDCEVVSIATSLFTTLAGSGLVWSSNTATRVLDLALTTVKSAYLQFLLSENQGLAWMSSHDRVHTWSDGFRGQAGTSAVYTAVNYI